MKEDDIKQTLEEIKLLENGFLIVGGADELAYGTLDHPQSLFVWTTKEKAEAFLEANLYANDDAVKEMPMTEIINFANKYKFGSIRFNFVVNDPPYVCLAIGNYLSLGN